MIKPIIETRSQIGFLNIIDTTVVKSKTSAHAPYLILCGSFNVNVNPYIWTAYNPIIKLVIQNATIGPP